MAALAVATLGPAGAEETAPDGPAAEVKLTEETLASVIAATKEMQALAPADAAASDETASAAELDARMDEVVKKHGFADGEAYGQAYESAVQAFAVIDWTSEARKQEAASEIAAINADPSLTEEAKKEAITGVEQELAAPAPDALPENVELVRKHEAEMRELLSSDLGP
jgi:hypothetical protein